MSSRLEELHAFVSVAEQNSFTRAALASDLAKSSISKRVSDLEKRLGAQLLRRTTRKVILTDQGKLFYDVAVKILRDLDEAEQLVSDYQQEIKGRIKLTAPLSFANRHLSSLLIEFKKKYPQIDLSLDLSDRRVDLLGDGLDLALRIGTLEDSSLLARRLSRIKFACCASPEYLQQYGVPEHPNELSNHLGLYYSNVPDNTQWQFQVNGEFGNYLPFKQLTASNGDFLIQASEQGLGLLMAPTFLVYDHLKRGVLVPVLGEFPCLETEIYAVFPPGRMITLRVRLLVDIIRQHLGDDPCWDSKGGCEYSEAGLV